MTAADQSSDYSKNSEPTDPVSINFDPFAPDPALNREPDLELPARADPDPESPNLKRVEDADQYNRQALNGLVRAIARSQGEFSLILVHCNYRELQVSMVKWLRDATPVPIQEVFLPAATVTLYTTLQEKLAETQPQALMVFGLEGVDALGSVLTAANNAREEFRKHFRFPLILWVNDGVLRQLIRLAPDFENWAITFSFITATHQLIQAFRCGENQLFDHLLKAGVGRFLSNTDIFGDRYYQELLSALRDLRVRQVPLDETLQASLEFVLGREVYGKDYRDRAALDHYQASLAYWQEIHYLERQGYVLYSLGLWWLTYAAQNRAEHRTACERARAYLQHCIEVFERAGRADLVIRFINALGTVLHQLNAWDDLEKVANQALALHQRFLVPSTTDSGTLKIDEPFRRARIYGFLAEVALARCAWARALRLAQKALATLEQGLPPNLDDTSPGQRADLEWEQSFHQGWYLLALARAQQGLGQHQASILTLQQARVETKPAYDPDLYIRILNELQQGYFQQRQYLEAFRIRLERRALEHKFGFRAFLGADRLQPKQFVTNPALAVSGAPQDLAEEFAVSGRQQAIAHLIERLTRNDQTLTILHGQSGVGKSSILQAGLVPHLQQQIIGSRQVIPVLQQVYPDWSKTLGQTLNQNLGPGELNSATDLDSIPGILHQLRQNREQNTLTLLIFDQFEEFFFVYKELQQRQVFYDFLRDCLNTPYVKVILSLREDYLHYLLECNRFTDLSVINNNILDKNILFYLGNFSREEAEAIMQKATAETQFSPEPELIPAVVQDLTRELGEVRPIELQIVGTQLQTEQITTLADYHDKGPKEKLVQRYVDTVVQACGPEHRRLAQLTLYLLTDEQNLRPLKSRADLLADLEATPAHLDLVLNILVSSGLVFQLPELPTVDYQLVHDYLVPYIRQSQEPELLAELKLTREQLKQSLAQEQQERWRAEIAEIEALSALSQALLLSHDQLKALVTIVKAGRKLRQMATVPAPTRQRTLEQFRQVLAQIRECNRLEGHEGAVLSVALSSEAIASGSTDGVIKLWSWNGEELGTLQRHHDRVLDLRFSPEGKILASVSADQTLRLWRRNGTLVRTVTGHSERLHGVCFSPNGQTLAVVGESGTIKLYQQDGTLRKTLNLGARIFDVCFSPDGQIFASASEYGTIRLWRVDPNWRMIKTFKGHSGTVVSLCFSPDGYLLASAGTDNTLKLWDLEQDQLKLEYPQPGRVFKVRFSPDGQLLAYAGAEGAVYLCNLAGDELASFRGHQGPIFGLDFSADGCCLVSVGEDKTVRLWSLDGIGPHTQQPHTGRILDVSFNPAASPQGQTFVSAGEDQTLKLWRFDGQLVRTFQGHETAVRCVSLSPDGELIVSGGVDGVVKLWQRDGTLLRTFQKHRASVRSLSFSPDGRLVASASNDQTVKLWNLNGVGRKTFHNHSSRVMSISFSPDGTLIAAASGRLVKLWHRDGILQHTLSGHQARVLHVCFSPVRAGGPVLASASADQTIKLWRSDGTLLRTLRGHEAGVKSVHFSPGPVGGSDDQMLVSVSTDGVVKLWDGFGELMTTIVPFWGQGIALCDAAFICDGQLLITVAEDGTIKLWSLGGEEFQVVGDKATPQAKICTRLTQNEADPDDWKALQDLLQQGCAWLSDYLASHPDERHLCDLRGDRAP